MKEVWICESNYPRTRWTFALHFSSTFLIRIPPCVFDMRCNSALFVALFLFTWSCIEFEASYVNCEDLYQCGRMSFKKFNPAVEVSWLSVFITQINPLISINPVNFSIGAGINTASDTFFFIVVNDISSLDDRQLKYQTFQSLAEIPFLPVF